MKNIHDIITLILVIDLWHKKNAHHRQGHENRNWCGRLVLISTSYCWVKWRDFAGIYVTTVEFNLVVVTSSSAQSSHHGDVFLIPLCWIGFPIQSEWYCFFLFVFFLTYTFHLQDLTTHILTFTNKQSNIC